MAVSFIQFVNTTGTTSGAGTTYPSASFMCMFCRSLSVLFFLLASVLSVLRFTDSDYPFGIFKLFL